MDDYSLNSLTESKNEWCSRLVSILTFNMIEGINSIYKESIKLCLENQEENKYLMTFQNLLSKIPDWTNVTIETERKRIETVSHCKYLEDLVTCVHLIQLKALTCIRVGLRQKKIDIDIPNIDKFIHKCYINIARKIYSNVYLFEKEVMPLEKQRNNRELEILIKEAILMTIRDNIPVEQILRIYMDETEEYEEVNENNKLNETKEEIKNLKEELSINKENKENVPIDYEDKLEKMAEKINNSNEDFPIDDTKEKDNKSDGQINLKFSDIDSAIDSLGQKEEILAPKDLESIEKRNIENKIKESQYDDLEDDAEESLNIGDDISLNIDAINLGENLELKKDEILDIEEL